MVDTGETHTMQENAELAFAHAGLDYRKHVSPDPDLFRPAEVTLLQGDATTARRKLGWSHRTGFQALVSEMVEADCQALGLNAITRVTAG